MSIGKKRPKLAARRRNGAVDRVVPPTDLAERRRGRGRPKLMSDADQAGVIARQAHDLFLEKGYARTTMDDIVAHCRISKSTLYRLFANKMEVFGAVIDDHRQSMLALPGDYDHLPIDKALAQIFQVDIDEEANQRRMALIRLVFVEAGDFPELHQLLHERGGDRSRLELSKWLEAQKANGRVDFPDAYDAAKALMDLMFGAIVIKSHGVNPEWPNRKERVRYLHSCIGMFTLGILPRKSVRQ